MQGRKKAKGPVGGSSSYSQTFRDHVARDYELGDLSYAQISDKYGLPNKDMVKWWVRCYRKKGDIVGLISPRMTEKEKRENAALRKRIAELEKQAGEQDLKILLLETMIDIAEEELEVDIRKKPGTRQ